MKNWDNCKEFLENNNAPKRLVRHLEIVSSVAQEICDYILNIGIPLDVELIICGAGLHDVGKIIYKEELNIHGNKHEKEGELFLIKEGISKEIAKFCIYHAEWQKTEKIEYLLIALSDKLWKGHRNSELELKIIDYIAKEKEIDRWDIFLEIDRFFESIADSANERITFSKID
jgi:putative nucleotidyltransferase with HDIG domain